MREVKLILSVLLTITVLNNIVEGKHWALIVAGSNGFYNYRHQVRNLKVYFLFTFKIWHLAILTVNVHTVCASLIERETLETLIKYIDISLYLYFVQNGKFRKMVRKYMT